MAQTSVLLSHPVALDYESTLVLAIELSNTSCCRARASTPVPS